MRFFYGDFDGEKISRRFYCNFPNSRHRDIAAVLNMFKFHRDIGAIVFAEKIAPKIAVSIARVNGPLCAKNPRTVYIEKPC